MFKIAIVIFAASLSFVVADESKNNTSDICILPPFPKNGFYEIRDESTYSSFENVTKKRLDYFCRQGFKLSGPSFTTCYNGFWTHGKQPDCLSQCVLDKDHSVNYLCLPHNSRALEDAYICDEVVDESTTVRPRCRSPYYNHTGDLKDMLCKNGVWNYVATCTPDCGIVSHKKPLDAENQSGNNGGTPWHVGVYFKLKDPYLQICGGSIITSDVVISAAHCFWGEVKKQRPASDFAVAAGKFYRHWHSQLDHNAQKSDVLEIKLPARFSGLKTYYRDDIAALKIATPFRFGEYVSPVCINFNYNFDSSQLAVGRTGKIASWGRSAQDGVESHWQFLQEVNLPYVTDEQCLMDAPLASRKYITADKFCAYYNNTARELCQGDTGGGLAFPAHSRGRERYFLRGVASTSRGDKQYCVMFTTFTQVIKHDQFIKEYYTPSVDKCILPPFPDNGTHSGKPGEAFDTVNIRVTCNQGYTVDGPSSLYCYNGLWSDQVPKCVSQCHVDPHFSVEYICFIPGGGHRACNEYERSGTVVRPRCRSPEYYSIDPLKDMLCVYGIWSHEPECSAECGFDARTDSQFTLTKQNVARGDAPWHAGIYEKTKIPYQQICGATLISTNIVISAAHCFWSGNKMTEAANYGVSIGNLYRPWKPLEETQYKQQSDVKEVHLPGRFQGDDAYFQYDIAVVIVAVPFNYTPYVRPACLDFNVNFNRKQLQPGGIGKVVGWGLISADGEASPVLKYLNIPYVQVETCISGSPQVFRPYIGNDKICGGYTSATSPLSPVCRGDSGGGWVFPEPHEGKIRFFLRGIISTAPSSDDKLCNLHAYTVFEAIQRHEDFIKQYWKGGERYKHIPPIDGQPL